MWYQPDDIARIQPWAESPAEVAAELMGHIEAAGVSKRDLKQISLLVDTFALALEQAWYKVDRLLELGTEFFKDDEEYHAQIGEAALTAEGLDPRGWYAYLLLDDADAVIYVGMSQNVCGRIGTHMKTDDRAARIASVRLIRAADEASCRRLERSLIERYLPELNIMLMPKVG